MNNEHTRTGSSKAIDNYLSTWEEGRKDRFESLARKVETECEQFLKSQAFLSETSRRVKEGKSLKSKLIDRNGKRKDPYKGKEDIESDIKDLAGVRIAVHFPSNKAEVLCFLEKTYDIDHQKSHDGLESKDDDEYKPKFKGYQAKHLIAKLRKPHEPEFTSMVVEIQVMSILRKAWAGVDHDMLYKQLDGKPSNDEKIILDGLNGLVTMGEWYLERLWETNKSRVISNEKKEDIFGNEFVLGVFLSEWIGKNQLSGIKAGSVEALHRFLTLPSVALESPAKLRPALTALKLPPRFESSMDDPSWTVSYGRTNASVVIMHRLFTEYDGGRLQKQSQSILNILSPEEKCRVLASTMISLDELFSPPSKWERELNRQDSNPAHKSEQLRWLLNHTAPKRFLTGERPALSSKNQEYLDLLWTWFQEHRSPMVQFVFGISKLGLLRVSHEDLQVLPRIAFMLDQYRAQGG